MENFIASLVDANPQYRTEICPRCGRKGRLLALSRYVNVSICDDCGADEAILAYFRKKSIPEKDWFICKMLK